MTSGKVPGPGSSYAGNHVGRPPRGFRTPNAPKVAVTAVPCPEEHCRAEPGEKCLTQAGVERSTVHTSRRRIAIREGY